MYNGGDGTITVCDLNSICSADNNSVLGPLKISSPLFIVQLIAEGGMEVVPI